jgi:3-dehydroquinate synthase
MITSDLYGGLKAYLEATPKGQLFVVVDENTATKCMPLVAAAIGDMAFETILIDAGEEHKSLDTVEHIWNTLYTHHATREALLLNIGGGMLTDIAGFAAATYMRGIKYVNIPTTLLAMVDASSGGKTGFNYKGVKNMIGAFATPEQTILYLPLLDTLSVKEWLSGYAEMLKHALLESEDHLAEVLSIDVNDAKCSISTELLARNIAVKERIVAQDPKEKGLRKLLNFGHTVGHAIEEAYHADGRSVPHGYCVLWGMVAELYLSVVKMGLDKHVLTQMSRVMLEYYGRPECNCKERERLTAWMLKDKKNKVAGEINFSLLKAVGEGMVDQTVTKEELDEALEYLFSL